MSKGYIYDYSSKGRNNLLVRINQEYVNKWHLEEYDSILSDIEDIITTKIAEKSIKFEYDYTNILLRKLAMAIIDCREICALCAIGLVNGAVDVLRNLFEQLVVLLFFQEKQTAHDFKQYVENYFEGFEPKRVQLLSMIAYNAKSDIPDLDYVNRYMSNANNKKKLNNNYWWSGKSNFYELFKETRDLLGNEKLIAFMDESHIIYKYCCLFVHTGFAGDILSPGEAVDSSIINTAQSSKGQILPLFYSALWIHIFAGEAINHLCISDNAIIEKIDKLIEMYDSYMRSL